MNDGNIPLVSDQALVNPTHAQPGVTMNMNGNTTHTGGHSLNVILWVGWILQCLLTTGMLPTFVSVTTFANRTSCNNWGMVLCRLPFGLEKLLL